MTPFNKKGPGAPTHVLVDMLGHPAVELTQAEDAVQGSGARADLVNWNWTYGVIHKLHNANVNQN